MKVAIVCDYLNVYGGAERTLESILEIYPEATIFTSLYDPSKFRDGSPIRKVDVRSVFDFRGSNPLRGLDPIKAIVSSLPKHFTFVFPYFFERLNLSGYDLIISVGTIWAKGVKTGHNHQRHVFYCLTPPRFLYGYSSETSKRNVWYYKPFTTVLDHWLRIWDFNASQKPDEMLVISEEVKRRVKKFYRRDSVVIYPPVFLPVIPESSSVILRSKDPKNLPAHIATQSVAGGDPSVRIPQDDEDRGSKYFLIVSRLAAYKGIDVAIKACNELKLPLKIVGTGREEEKLRSMAGPTVEFLGFRSDAEIDKLYRGARALIFPTPDEDFGIVPLEANAHGVPVIAHKSGGPLETLVEGKTAIFFSDEEGLKEVLTNFDGTKYSPEECFQNAKRFSLEEFQKNLKQFIDSHTNL